MTHAVPYNFPYNIFDPCCITIRNISGFFSNVINEGTAYTVNIPGDLFKNCVNLENVSRCFSGFNIPFNPTANGFINCTKLKDVSYLFSRTSQFLSFLPPNFFNIGFTDSTKTIIGAGINELTINIPNNADAPTLSNGIYTVVVRDTDIVTSTRYKNVTIESGVITYNPTSTYSQRVDTRTNGI
jgi:hypothetical protein